MLNFKNLSKIVILQLFANKNQLYRPPVSVKTKQITVTLFSFFFTPYQRYIITIKAVFYLFFENLSNSVSLRSPKKKL
jgi:hypothetical protein